MQFPVCVIVDIPDDQAEHYAAICGLPQVNGRVPAKDKVARVQQQVIAATRRDFQTLGIQADVQLKTR